METFKKIFKKLEKAILHEIFSFLRYSFRILFDFLMSLYRSWPAEHISEIRYTIDLMRTKLFSIKDTKKNCNFAI